MLAKNKKMIQITVDENTYNAINEFRWSCRFESISKAGKEILLAGMKALADEFPELDVNTKLETGKKAGHDVVAPRVSKNV